LRDWQRPDREPDAWHRPDRKRDSLEQYSLRSDRLRKQAGLRPGNSLDNWIIIPLTTYNKNYGTQQDSLRITSRAGSAAKIQDSVDEVRQIMRGRHHLAYAKPDDFAIETSDSFLSLWKTSAALFSPL